MKKRSVLLGLVVVAVAVSVAISGDDALEARRMLAKKGMEEVELVARGSGKFDYTARRGVEVCTGSLGVGFFHWVKYNCQ
jgi:hypothetical protein